MRSLYQDILGIQQESSVLQMKQQIDSLKMKQKTEILVNGKIALTSTISTLVIYSLVAIDYINLLYFSYFDMFLNGILMISVLKIGHRLLYWIFVLPCNFCKVVCCFWCSLSLSFDQEFEHQYH